MLTFFRRIRKGFLDVGAARKYLLYAVGEILLVMIGILLALQVNNWNEDRKNQTQVNTLLSNLIDAVNDDVKWLERIQTTNSFRVESTRYVLRLAGKKYELLDSREKNPMFNFEQIDLPDTNLIWNQGYLIPLT